MQGEAREFFDAGRFLERGDQTARILDVKYHDLLPRYQRQESPAPLVPTPIGPVPVDPTDVGGPVDVHGWATVLKSVGAFEAFRKTYRQGISPDLIVQFLVLSQDFPASLRFCVGKTDNALRRISGNRDLSPGNEAERKIGKLYNELNYTTADEIIAGGLHEFLEEVQVKTIRVGEAIHDTYLQY
jgi:uncharacterized alpha-E superfamily protein